jgi:CheY-like chemotaxis protein
VAAGCELTFADDGLQAFDAALQGTFDLFLFDVSMPGMDGPAALQAIARTYRRLRRAIPPAAAVTANVLPEQLEAYAEAGFADCVAKPVKKAALMACIARLTQREMVKVA